jgi:hypothetical protein
LKSPRNDTGIAMTNLHRSPPMNQSKTDLGIVNESQLLRFGITDSAREPYRVETYSILNVGSFHLVIVGARRDAHSEDCHFAINAFEKYLLPRGQIGS